MMRKKAKLRREKFKRKLASLNTKWGVQNTRKNQSEMIKKIKNVSCHDVNIKNKFVILKEVSISFN